MCGGFSIAIIKVRGKKRVKITRFLYLVSSLVAKYIFK